MGEPRNGPVQQALEAISGTLSVPQVFVNGEFMGDNSAIQVTRGVTLEGGKECVDVI